MGWTEIDPIVIETTERLQADLIEIDENLCRSELTAGQRSSFTKRRKSIWEALHPVSSQKFESVWDALPAKPNAQRAAVFDEDEIQVGQVVPPVIGYGESLNKPKPLPQKQLSSLASRSAMSTATFLVPTLWATTLSIRLVCRNLQRQRKLNSHS